MKIPKVQGIWDRSRPVGSRGEEGFGRNFVDSSLRRWSSLFTDFHSTNDQNLEISHKLYIL